MTQPVDADLVDLLVSREGIPTLATLNSGERLIVLNIAWGYDDGDQHAHVTTNVSPAVDGASVQLFSTSDIRSVADVTGQALI